MKIEFFILLLFINITSCTSDSSSIPKPRSYPHISFPTGKWEKFDTSFCHFTFQYPSYAKIVQEKKFFDQNAPNPCWFNISVPSLGSFVYCSYYRISPQKSINSLINDAFQMAGKHNVKANYIEEISIKKGNNLNGFIFDINGPVASPYQFYITDSVKHFLRGALYFNSEINQDSLAPSIAFMKKDIVKIIESMQWKP